MEQEVVQWNLQNYVFLLSHKHSETHSVKMLRTTISKSISRKTNSSKTQQNFDPVDFYFLALDRWKKKKTNEGFCFLLEVSGTLKMLWCCKAVFYGTLLCVDIKQSCTVAVCLKLSLPHSDVQTEHRTLLDSKDQTWLWLNIKDIYCGKKKEQVRIQYCILCLQVFFILTEQCCHIDQIQNKQDFDSKNGQTNKKRWWKPPKNGGCVVY